MVAVKKKTVAKRKPVCAKKAAPAKAQSKMDLRVAARAKVVAARDALNLVVAKDFLAGFTAEDVAARNRISSAGAAHAHKQRFINGIYERSDPRREIQYDLARLEGTIELELIQARRYQDKIVPMWRKGLPITQVAASVGVLARIARAAVYLAVQEGSDGGAFVKKT